MKTWLKYVQTLSHLSLVLSILLNMSQVENFINKGKSIPGPICLTVLIYFTEIRLCGVVVMVLESMRVDHESARVKPKTIKLAVVTSPLSTHHGGASTKNGSLGVSIIWQSEAKCLLVDCELALYKSIWLCLPSTKQRVSLY